MLLITVDPGLRDAGVALWSHSGALLRAELARVPGKDRGAVPFAKMAAEVYKVADGMCEALVHGDIPKLDISLLVEDQHFNFNRTPNANDLAQVTGVTGAVAAYFLARGVARIASVLPEKWKGSIKKEDMTERIRRRLGERNELWRVDACVPKSLVHNVLDACGIGLWKLGVLEPRRVLHRE